MKVILDSNVLFSALISPHSPPQLIYQAWRDGRFELLTCREQLDEIRRASRYPKLQRFLQPTRVGTLINTLERGPLVTLRGTDIDIDDADDAFLLDLAESGQADVLVTGDHRAGLLRRGHHGPTRIVSPGQFCALFLKG
jgi:putative PIN family toxin of toxin-antitoxin system